jgi:hypothetical protein
MPDATDSKKVLGAPSVDRQESIKHGRHQDGAAVMAFRGLREKIRLGFRADILAQRLSPCGAGGELACKPAQQTGAFESAVLLDMREYGLGQRKMREQRHDIGEGLVKCETVQAGRFRVAAVQTVEYGMGRFMRDDVVGKCCEYPVGAGRGIGAAEISEQQGSLLSAVIGIGFPKRVRIDTQLPDRDIFSARPVRRPDDLSSKRALEQTNDLHRDREHHLLMELRIAFRRCQPVLRQKIGIVEIDRLVELAACRIDVDDFQIFIDRANREGVFPGLFPRQRNRRIGIPNRAQRARRLRIKSIDQEFARGRVGIPGFHDRCTASEQTAADTGAKSRTGLASAPILS